MKTCPFCAEEIQEVAIVCKHCGRDLTGPNAGNVSVRRARRNWPYVVLGCLVLMYAVGSIAQFAESTFKPNRVPPDAASIPSKKTETNPAHAMLASQSEVRRGAKLRDTVLSAQGQCDRATRTFLRGLDSDGNAYWAVACRNGKSYLVEVRANATGSTTVTSCDAFRSVTGGDCFKPF